MKKEDILQQNARADVLEMILQELVFLQNAQEMDDMQVGINKLLEAIQIYTNADRVYIFETVDNGNIFRNTYEFCKSGVTSQISNLSKIVSGDMPYWYQEFLKGNSIVIEDVEKICYTMPHEYALLKAQDVVSEIAFPVYHAPRLFGFLGLDNPNVSQSMRLINLLGVVGGYLASIFDSRTVSSCNKNISEESERDKLYLGILCQEYTSVYYLNLLDGLVDVIKISPLSHATGYIGNNINEKHDYVKLIRYYASNYVTGDKKSFLENMTISHLKEMMNKISHVAYRYETIPNAAGKKHSEVQIIKVKQDKNEFGVMLGFRYIDTIIEIEKSQQEKLEDALRKEQLNNEIIGAISKIYFSIYRINLETNYYDEVTSNSEIHQLTGKSGNAAEKMYEICETFVSEEYQESVRHFFEISTLAERLEHEDTIAIEYHAKDGNWHLARFIVKKRNEDGRVTNVLYVTRLISEDKMREQNLILIAEEANRANEAKTEFLSKMAHDIRTPMNALSGFTKIAEKNFENQEVVAHSLHQIDAACRYLEQIVDDVLDLTRIEYGKILVHLENANVKTEFSSLLENTSAIAQNKELKCVTNIHDIFYPYLSLDVLHLKQIFVNLISNAIKYTPDHGSVIFELYEETCETAGKVKLVARIKDNGIGMSEEFMKKMYDKFTREVDTRINQVRGSGLGLAVVKELVNLLKGKIEVESRLGEGTCFTVSFEVTICEEGNQSKEEAISDIGMCEGMCVLVAEDNELNYEVAEGMLSMYGVSCEHAKNGAECVEMFQKALPGKYQAILMDMQMPVMTGLEATRTIRRLSTPTATTIPIIGLTANAFESDVKDCLSVGMNAHFSKPFDVEKLLKKICELRKL